METAQEKCVNKSVDVSSSLTVEALRASVKRHGVTVGDRITVGPLLGWRPIFFVSADYVQHKLFPPSTSLETVQAYIAKALKNLGDHISP